MKGRYGQNWNYTCTAKRFNTHITNRGGVRWSRRPLCIMVSNGSQFIVHDGGASALGVGFREADPRPWKMVPGRGSMYDDDGGPALVQRMRSSMRQMRCGGRVRRYRRGGARRLRCRGEVYFAAGMENVEYSGVLLWVPGWGWLGRVNLKLRKQPPTKHHP